MSGLFYSDENDRKRAEMARTLDTMKRAGIQTRPLADIVTDYEKTGAAAIGTRADGATVAAFDATRFHIGEVITLPGATDGARRMIYGCPLCGVAYLHHAPEGTKPGDILPDARPAVKPCPDCTEQMEAAAVAETRADHAARKLAAMPPASPAMN